MPFTIGLFGKWGTGKSSVINILESKLDKKRFNYLPFDVWKYQNDSLRRQFLIQIDEKLQLGLDYRKKLNQNLTEIEPVSLKKDSFKLLKSIFTRGTFILLCILILFSIVRFTPIISYLNEEKLISSNLIDLFYNASLITFILSFLLAAMDKFNSTYTINRTDSAEGFEWHFKEEVLNRKKIKGKRNIIVFDNLDRCTHLHAVDILTTLKTFLEVDKCIFIIPCDDNAIKTHIRTVYTTADKSLDLTRELYSDEFLRKFFNLYIRIPEFIDTELQKYTEDLLKAINTPELNTPEIASIITTAFRDNPRQIKQFINTLLSHYLLAKDRESLPDPLIVHPGAVTGQMGLFAKLLVIQQKYPDQYARIKNKEVSISEIPKINNLNDKTEQEFIAFMKTTLTTPKKKISNLNPFFYLKQSSDERNLPDADELGIALEDAKNDVVIEKFKEIKKSDSQVNSCAGFINKLLRDNENRPQRLLNIVATFLNASSALSFNFQNQNLYDNTALVLGTTLKELLHRIKPQLIFDEVISRCSEQYKVSVVDQYVEILEAQNRDENNPYELTVEWIKDIVINIFMHHGLFSDKDRQLRNVILTNYAEDRSILELLRNNKPMQSIYLTPDVIEKYINSITKTDLANKDEFVQKINLAIDFKDSFSVKNVESILKKLSELMKHENQQIYGDSRKNLLAMCKDILLTFYDKINEITTEIVEQLVRDVINGINSISKWSQRGIYIASAIILADFAKDSSKSNLSSLIKQFFASAELTDIKDVLEVFDDKTNIALVKDYYQHFQQRSSQSKEFLEYVLKISDTDTQKKILMTNIISQHMSVIEIIEKNETKILLSDAEITKIILDNAARVPPSIRTRFYALVIDRKCGRDSNLINQYIGLLKSDIMNADSSSQNVGYEALRNSSFLSDVDKRLITKEIIQWLKQKTAISHADEYAIESIMLYWNILGRPNELGDFLYVLLDKILLRSMDVKLVEVAARCINKIRPDYDITDDTKRCFADLKERAQTVDDTKIKNILAAIFENPDKVSPASKVI